MTTHGSKAGSVGAMSLLDPDKEQDWCDNVLLEYEFALCLLEAFPLSFKIMPILAGAPDERGYTTFDFNLVNNLADVPSEKTKLQLSLHCSKYRVPLTEQASKRSIRETVKSICKHQGIQMWTLGSSSIAADCAAERMLLTARKVRQRLAMGKRVESKAWSAPTGLLLSRGALMKSKMPSGMQRASN